jgi:hypothetical protein
MKSRFSTAAAIALALLPAASPAVDGNIGIFADVEMTEREITVACGATTTLFVYALLQGATADGISGAEYSLAIGPYISEGCTEEDLSPDGMVFLDDYQPSHALDATVVGVGASDRPDPDNRGINIAFPTCQAGDDAKILLQTIQVWNFGCSDSELRLRVIKHDDPSNPFLWCPLFTLCNPPVFTKICLGEDVHQQYCAIVPPFVITTISSSGEFVLNPSPVIAIERQTWSAVKRLYQ